MLRTTLPAACLLACFAVGEAMAVDRYISVTYRDFVGDHTGYDNTPEWHPDFENDSFFEEVLYSNKLEGATTGIVLTDLGADGTPQRDPNAPLTWNDNAFHQWYHDLKPDGVTPNPRAIRLDKQMLLTNQGGGFFAYDSENDGGFFPIDGEGWHTGYTEMGDRTNLPPCSNGLCFGPAIQTGHNWHFTTMIGLDFNYDASAGKEVTVSGDDDVWVFVNGKLVIDLGGLHNRLEERIVLDATLEDVDGNPLNLTTGQSYSLDIFHAERHRNDSNFSFETTLSIGTQVGDIDGDDDIDTGDITTAIVNFTGAFGVGKTLLQGDTDGDGDVDTVDLTSTISRFTGAMAANPNVPDLIYDPATGNVTIDADGADVISFSLQPGPFNAADFSELPAGLTDNIAAQIGWTSFNLFSGLTGTANLGAILPAGLDQAGLEAALSTASYGLALAGGGGGGRLDIIIPEPATVGLMLLAGTLFLKRRRFA